LMQNEPSCCGQSRWWITPAGQSLAQPVGRWWAGQK
jgi:hypothetical protein